MCHVTVYGVSTAAPFVKGPIGWTPDGKAIQTHSEVGLASAQPVQLLP